jgi:hypothetical protein
MNNKNAIEINERNKKIGWLSFFDYVLIILLITLIIVISFGLIYMKSEGSKCLYNPLVYGVQQLEKTNNGKYVTCTCSKDSTDIKLFVTDKNISEVNYQ